MHRVVSLHAHDGVQEHQEVKAEKDELTGKLSDKVIEIFINLRDLAESIVIIIVCLSECVCMPICPSVIKFTAELM